MDNLEERIAEVQHIRSFGEELGLDFGEAFTEIDIGPKSPTSLYWLYVSFRDKIAVPELRAWPEGWSNKQYTHKSSARRRQKKLEEQGFDTYLFEGEAAGSNDCPITLALLEAKHGRRIDVVLHEGFHINCNLKDNEAWRTGGSREWYISRRLDEAIASVVGHEVAIEYARIHNPEVVEKLESGLEWWLKLSDFTNKYYDELEACYQVGGNREEVFARIREEDPDGKLIDDDELTNAYFLRMIEYTRDTPLVHRLFKGVDVKDYLADPTEIHKFLCSQIGEEFYA